jgi:predicted alpha/beta-hydrolase family hydrolase
VAVRPPQLDEAWLEAVPWLRGPSGPAGLGEVALYAGGRSAGARVACRTADALGVRGVVCLAFPLHLPGRPERSRAAELLAPSVPRLVLQGSRDTFGGTAEVAAAVAGAPGVRLVDLPGADHGYRLARGAAWSAADLRETLVAEVGRFLAGE